MRLAQHRLTTYEDEICFTFGPLCHFISYDVKQQSIGVWGVSNSAQLTFNFGLSKVEYSAYMSCRGCLLLFGGENGQNKS